MKAKCLLLFAFVLLGTNAGQAQTLRARLAGVVVNGTQDGKPVAGAEIVLRAGEEGSLQAVAQTVSDVEGRFVFDKVPAAPGLILIAGANHHGIHYPGPRIQAPPGAVMPSIRLVVFDSVSSPNPLVADVHEIDVQIQAGVLEVTEAVWVNNPSLTTYVGQTGNEPVTLRLSIPDGFERVTFHQEFNGRRFKLIDKCLVTDIPWTPGKREVRFTYHLPIEEGKPVLEWSADLPCAQVRLRVRGESLDRLESNLQRVVTPDSSTIVFESSGPSLPAGYIVKLQLGSVPTPWIVYLRWMALGVLAFLILATSAYRFNRRRQVKPLTTVRTSAATTRLQGHGASARVRLKYPAV